MSSLSRKHFIDIQGATKEDLNKVIDTGFTFREVLDRRVKKDRPMEVKNLRQFIATT